MSDTENNDNGLPPKLNLSSKIAKPDAKPVPTAKSPAAPTPSAPKPQPVSVGQSPSTSRITLSSPTPKPADSAKPASSAKPTLSAAPKNAQPTVRLKPRPKLSTSAKPKITSKPAASSTAASAIKLTPKPAVGIKRSSVDPNAPVGSKRSTSKIALAEADTSATDDGSVNSKTIKIKPSVDIKTLSGKIPLALDQNAPETDTPTVMPDPKRQTSRISLESALGTETEKPTAAKTDDKGPKTIRLKRPGSSATVNIGKDVKTDKPLSKTSKIEQAPNSEAPATQKKTIKVKRPSQRRTAKKLSVKRAADDSTDAGTDSGIPVQPLSSLAPVQAPDTAHWTFIFSAVASVLIIGVLIYVLSAEAFGPNISLTELSYGAPDVDLPWPGKIQN